MADSTPAPVVNLDTLGVFYLVLAIVWTLFVASGMLYLIRNRHIPLLRIRGLSLSLTAIAILHVYWFIVQIVYVVRPSWSQTAEYWIMALWLPSGIALFHASNARFLSVARGQRQFLGGVSSVKQRQWRFGKKGKKVAGVSSWVERFRELDHTGRMLVVVGGLMGLQLLFTLVSFLASRKYHPSFGVGSVESMGSSAREKPDLARGWEWWPTVLWQFAWAWLVAPVIMFQARYINDTFGWRTQTIGCCLSGLHAAPLWLIALYSAAFDRVNQSWIPPQWIAISIMAMEIFTVFLPCYQTYTHQTLRHETIEAIAAWETKSGTYHFQHNVDNVNDLLSLTSTKVGSAATGGRTDKDPNKHTTKRPTQQMIRSITSSSSTTALSSSGHSSASKDSLMSMSALEHVLKTNPGPLREYSALRDLSGENIAFLTAVAEWKAGQQQPQSTGPISPSATGDYTGGRDGGAKRPAMKRFALSQYFAETHGIHADPALHLPPSNANVTTTTTTTTTTTVTTVGSCCMSQTVFADAVRIYMDFISPRTAEFNINLSSKDLVKLQDIFDAAAKRVAKRSSTVNLDGDDDDGLELDEGYDPVTPFDSHPPRSEASSRNGNGDGSGADAASIEPIVDPVAVADVAENEQDGGVPADQRGLKSKRLEFSASVVDLGHLDMPGVDEKVFDDAVAHVKYLVLTNTWPKFVKERRAAEAEVVATRGEGESDSGVFGWARALFGRIL